MAIKKDLKKPKKGSFNRGSIFSITMAVAVMCVVLGFTKQSVVVSAFVVFAVLMAIVTFSIRQLRGEIVIILMIAVPLLVAAGAFLSVFLNQ